MKHNRDKVTEVDNVEPRRRSRSIRVLDGNNIATIEQNEEEIKYYTGKDYEAIEKARYDKMMRELGLSY